MEKSILLTTLGMGLLMMALKAGAQNLPVDKVGEGPQLYAFKCNGNANQTLKVKHYTDENSTLKASIQFSEAQDVQHFSATVQIQNDFLFFTHSYELFNGAESVGQLKIVNQKMIGRGGCGRDGCLDQLGQTIANLKIGEYETTLDCQ